MTSTSSVSGDAAWAYLPHWETEGLDSGLWADLVRHACSHPAGMLLMLSTNMYRLQRDRPLLTRLLRGFIDLWPSMREYQPFLRGPDLCPLPFVRISHPEWQGPKLHDTVRLMVTRPLGRVTPGMIVAIVHIFDWPERAYEVEFTDEAGQTIGMETLAGHELVVVDSAAA